MLMFFAWLWMLLVGGVHRAVHAQAIQECHICQRQLKRYFCAC